MPYRDHYARDLDWVELGIWSLYNGIDDEFIKSLYDRILNPRGGWRTSWDFDLPDPLVLPDPIDDTPE
ncbi:hypothetical protein [Posidoniimonas polymericola]|uniref:hypothetical protein n=1 Tax=Posidoniimonas polymericola TaxID=2528002 RepID=UPI0011B5F408|nr:hypothetical protein [Posidoniimonas polymericola]